jgi:hypothetical protein
MAGAVIGALRFDVGADTSQFELSMKSVEQSLSRVATKGAAFGVVLGNAITSAFSALAESFKHAIEAADRLDELAQKTGVSVEKLSSLRLAAETNSVSLEDLSNSLAKLGRNMAESVSDPTTTAARTFTAMGISAADASGKLRPVSDVLGDIAQKFATYQDGAGKAALAMNLFGKTGAELIPILNMGRSGLADVEAEARRLGITIDSDTAKKAAAFSDTMKKISLVWEGMIAQVAARLLPAMQQVAEAFVTLNTNGQLVTYGFAGLDVMWKNIISTGLLFKAVIDAINSQLGVLFATMAKIVSGDMSGAWQNLKTAPDAFAESVRKSKDAIVELWMATQQWQTTVTAAGAAAGQAMAPTVASAKSLADAQKAANDLIRASIDEVVNSPTETIVAKLDAISAGLQSGALNWKTYGQMVRKVEEENRNNISSTASLMASTLTTVFSKSKAAAIAAAIINTAVGITKALSTLPPPLSWAQAALIAASGAAQIATISRTNASGGSGGAPSVSGSGGSGADTSAAAMPQQLMVQGISPGQMFSGEVVRDFAQKLIDFQKDGGVVVLQ